MRKTSWLGWVSLAAALNGCGGGASSASGGPGAVLSFPVDAVLTRLATQPQTWSGRHVSSTGAVTWRTVTHHYAARQLTRVQTVTAEVLEPSIKTDTLTLDSTQGGLMVQTWTNDLGTFSTFTPGSQNRAPASAAVGATGSLAEVYVTSAQGFVFDKRNLTWTLTAVSPASAELCLNYLYSSQWGGGVHADCFVIDSGGEVLSYRGILRYSVAHVSADQVFQ